jgi:hypothetical protein
MSVGVTETSGDELQTDVKAVIIADIVGSSSLSDAARRQLDHDLRQLFEILNARYEPDLSARFDYTLGDEFEGVFARPELAIRPAFLLRAWLATQAATGHVQARCAIGVGTVSVENSGLPREQDGPAFHAARTLINSLHERDRRFGIRCSGRDPVVEISNRGFEIGCRFLDSIMTGWTEPQWEAAYWRWLNKSSTEVAELLHIKPQNVSKRLKSSRFRLVDETIRDFNQILREPALRTSTAVPS